MKIPFSNKTASQVDDVDCGFQDTALLTIWLAGVLPWLIMASPIRLNPSHLCR